MYANGFTLWHYTSPDSAENVLTADYFNSASDMLRVGDFIFCNLQINASACHGQLAVSDISSGAVTVSAPGFPPLDDIVAAA